MQMVHHVHRIIRVYTLPIKQHVHAIPKIKIFARTDEFLKQIPCAKTSKAYAHNAIWKPLTRELPAL